MASLLRLPVRGLDETSLIRAGWAGERRTPRNGLAPSTTARALVGQSSGGSGGGGSSSDAQRLEAFLAASPATKAGAKQEHGEWVPPLPRRHLRLRQVHKELPAAAQPVQLARQPHEQENPNIQEAQLAKPQQGLPAAPQAAGTPKQQGSEGESAQAGPQQGSQQLQPLDAHQDAPAAHQQQGAQQQDGHGAQQQLQAAAAPTVASGSASELPHQVHAPASNSGAAVAGLVRRQLAASRQVAARKLRSIQQATAQAQKRVAAATTRQQHTPQQARQHASRPAQQQGAAESTKMQHHVAQQQATVTVAALQQYFAALQLQVQQLLVALARLPSHQLAVLQRVAPQLHANLQGTPRTAPVFPQQQRLLSQRQAATLLDAQRQRPQQAVQTVAPPSAAPLAAQPHAPAAAAAPNALLQWAWLVAVAAAAVALAALRWARARRRVARTAQQAIREAEQRARAAKVYDRTRQRFQRALVAAEDLEGADSSVFTAVGRKGSATAAAAAVAGATGGGNPFLRGLDSSDGGDGSGQAEGWAEGGEGAQAVEEEAEEEADSTDVFDPASWDEATRKQWESFVSSSKVTKGKLWDSSQVDEGLPEVWVDLS